MVTGMGVISAIGQNLAENRDALIAMRGGISKLEHYPTRYAGMLPCGEIKRSSASLNDTFLGLADPSLPRTHLLALIAAKEAIGQSGLSPSQLASTETALIGASTVGGMCLTDELYHDARIESGGSVFLPNYDTASVTIAVQQHFNILGEVDTINTACSSSANAIASGVRLIRHGFARRAIVGGSDSLAKFTINGFNALNILSPDWCAPFDADRKGLNLGEGAAFLVLEKEEDIVEKKTYGCITGFGNSNDAYHPSSTSPEGEGPFLCMREALAMAGLSPAQIGYINAHGTGTENNDLTESVAMQRLFGTPPPFASTKSFTGHTLGAAGAMEAVYALLGLDHQELYPSLQFRLPITGTALTPLLEYRREKFDHVMSNSFGFGGNCTSVIFSKS